MQQTYISFIANRSSVTRGGARFLYGLAHVKKSTKTVSILGEYLFFGLQLNSGTIKKRLNFR